MPSEQYRPSSKTVVAELKLFTVDAVRKVMAFRSTNASKVGLETPITTQEVNVGDTGFEINNISTLVGISSIKPFVVELAQTNEILTYPTITHDVSFDGTSTVLHEDESLTITITDEDLSDPTKTVQVSNVDTGEIETVTLNQVGTTSTYTGTLPTVANAVAGTDEDGSLNAVIGNIINIDYTDATDSSGDPESVTYNITVTAVPTHTGVVKLERGFVAGSTLLVRLYDPDLTVSANVYITNSRTGQVENLVLVPTATPGLFYFNLSTLDDPAAGANDSGVMNLQVGDTLVCTYLDATNELGDPETIQDTLVVGTDVNVTGVVSHSGADKPNEPIIIRVEDADRETSVQVTAVNLTTNETETLTLLETQPLSGVFELELPTVLGEDTWYAGINNDGSMNVKENDIVRITYNDPVASTGLPFAVVHNVTMLAPDPEPTPPDPIVTEDIQTVTMTVTGLFFITGEMPNTTLTIKKTSTEQDNVIRCSLMVV